MRVLIILAVVSLLSIAAKTQPVLFEGMAGNEYLFYQHLIVKKFSPESPFGMMHIANVSRLYQTDVTKGGRPNEIMNQAYLTTNLSKSFTLLTGMFYTNVTGIRLAAGVQYALPFKNGLWVTVPRVDIKDRGAVEIMSMLELQPPVSDKTKLYIRLQAMSNYGPFHHNRSYQRFRFGVTINKTQIGVGVNLNEYGRASKTHVNTGIFVRKEII
ncbi:hypothetical protein PDL71_08045 [Lacibacter sp. MH-610]|uniref:hypothetical protein n=1 Tax=Lacibacter sp. MH-610 TaxID=3020883 RepID=UPI0038913D7A